MDPVPLREDKCVRPQQEAFNRLWKTYPDQVGELNDVYLKAQKYLDQKDQLLCHEIIRAVLAVTLALPFEDGSARPGLTREAQRARRFLEERAERRGRKRYAAGLYYGVAISLILLFIVAVVAIPVIDLFLPPDVRMDDAMSDLRDVLVCMAGGTVGAVISTIIRVSALERIDYRVVTWWTAAFRIVLGWLLAAALLFLIKGAILTVFKIPDAPPFFFWGGVGVLAGFNEIWARNLIARPNPKQ